MIPRSLFFKELRQILPWLLTVVGVELASSLLRLVDQAPDELAWSELTYVFSETDAVARSFLIGVWAMVLVYAGFPREYDDRTLPFLVGLPVSRPRLFITKQLVAALVLLVAVVLNESLSIALQLPNQTSFAQAAFRADWALVSLGTTAAVAVFSVGYAALLSVVRRFGVLLALLVWLTLELLREQFPSLRLLDVFRLLDVEFVGSRPVVPWWALGGHALASLSCSAVAAYFWLGYAERWPARLARFATRTSVRVAFVVLLAATLIAGAVVAFDDDHEPLAFGTLSALDSPEARRQTRHYHIRYPNALEPRVERLQRTADDLYERVERLLGATPESARVAVTMLESSEAHAGSATWNSIRIDPMNSHDDSMLERTLVHETVHVMALRVSERRLADADGTLRLFNEGLAEYVALRLVPQEAETRAHWLEAALAYRRSRPDPALLFDRAAFLSRFHEREVYALGFAFISALTASCGHDAPARALRALARGDASRDLAGEALVQDMLQSIRCDLSTVLLRWGDLLKTKADELRSDLERVPELSGAFNEADDDGLSFRVEIDGTPIGTATYTLVLRDDAGDSSSNYQTFWGTLESEKIVEFWVYDEAIGGEMVDYQLGMTWLESGAVVTHSTEWRRERVPR